MLCAHPAVWALQGSLHATVDMRPKYLCDDLSSGECNDGTKPTFSSSDPSAHTSRHDVSYGNRHSVAIIEAGKWTVDDHASDWHGDGRVLRPYSDHHNGGPRNPGCLRSEPATLPRVQRRPLHGQPSEQLCDRVTLSRRQSLQPS